MPVVPDLRPPDRARLLHLNGQVLVLREVHAGRVRTRADLTHQYGISRGSASELTARLRDGALLDEQPVDPSGRRGRPTSVLRPHPEGPLVCAVDISHEGWAVGLVALGGEVLELRTGRHGDRRPAAVFGPASAAARDLTSDYLHRVAVVSVSVTGVVRDSRIVQASTLRWRNVDVPGYFADLGRPILVGNDATLAGLAEARRGVASHVRVSLHLWIDVGVGGVLIVDGRPQTGATGAGGEFGHLPFGDPARRCPCGAYGCWDVEVDGRALARILGRPSPDDPRSLADAVLAEARAGDGIAQAAVDQIAANVGRGAGALVNALDPELVTLFGLGVDLLEVSGPTLRSAYRKALMAFRRADAPAVLASTVPSPASLIGAAENGFDHLLTETGLHEYITR
jgi:predicted NBD/HSP70 family sugar kinase